MLNKYLDVNGREIPENKKPLPNFSGIRRTSDNEIAAHYVRCELPRVRGLLWVGHCLNCKFHGGVAARGMVCKFDGKGAKNYIFDGLKYAK